MNWELLRTIAAWLGASATAVTCLVGIIVSGCKLWGKICSIDSTVSSTHAWVEELSRGKGLDCSLHNQRLDAVESNIKEERTRLTAAERTLREHSSEITQLKQQRAIHSRPA